MTAPDTRTAVPPGNLDPELVRKALAVWRAVAFGATNADGHKAECLCAQCEDGHGEHIARFAAEHAAERDREIARLRERLGWIAQQFCDRMPEDGGVYVSCGETSDCITEWCLPCYAREALDPKRSDKLDPELVAKARGLLALVMERVEPSYVNGKACGVGMEADDEDGCVEDIARFAAEHAEGLHDKTLELEVKLMETREAALAHAGDDYWAWLGDGTDDLASMSEVMEVRITARHLRRLVEGHAAELRERITALESLAESLRVAKDAYAERLDDAMKVNANAAAAVVELERKLAWNDDAVVRLLVKDTREVVRTDLASGGAQIGHQWGVKRLTELCDALDDILAAREATHRQRT